MQKREIQVEIWPAKATGASRRLSDIGLSEREIALELGNDIKGRSSGKRFVYGLMMGQFSALESSKNGLQFHMISLDCGFSAEHSKSTGNDHSHTRELISFVFGGYGLEKAPGSLHEIQSDGVTSQ